MKTLIIKTISHILRRRLFEWPEGEKLYFYGKYIEPSKDKEIPDKIKNFTIIIMDVKTVKMEITAALPPKNIKP